MEKYGIDNWPEIADYIGSKTSHECEVHYYTFYYKSATDKVPFADDIILEKDKNGKFMVNNKKAQFALAKASKYLPNNEKEKLESNNMNEEDKEFEKKPKEATKTEMKIKEVPNSEIIGYMPLRGDFNIEYDNDAELLLADMEFFDDDTQSEQELKYNILKLYNEKLDERIIRKKFVIENGLLDVKKQHQLDRKRPKEEREIYSQMKCFMRFCKDQEFQDLVEGLIEEKALRQRLEELKMFRSLGLETFDQVEKYLEKKHDNSDFSTGKAIGISLPSMKLHSTNRISKLKENTTPFNNNPKYKGLNDKEKELCNILIIQPDDYIELKEKIIEVAKKQELTRSSVLELMKKEMKKDKGFVIYDFLKFQGIIN